ncbi:MAG: hypothetical protein ACK5TV_01600, partial [Phycisphaerales bacterium]
MSVIPNKPIDVYEFSTARVGIWSAIAPQIGLTVAEVTALEDANDGFSTGTRSVIKTFIDETLPAGSTNMQYIIYGQRGSVRGPDSPI